MQPAGTLGGIIATRRRPGQCDEQLSSATGRNANHCVILPGVATLSGIPVVEAEDSAPRLGPTEAVRRRPWDLLQRRPAARLDHSQWPTPLPDPDQLKNYRFYIENITQLPGW